MWVNIQVDEPTSIAHFHASAALCIGVLDNKHVLWWTNQFRTSIMQRAFHIAPLRSIVSVMLQKA